MEILKISNNFHSIQAAIAEFEKITLRDLRFQVSKKLQLDFTKVNCSLEINEIVSQIGKTLNYWKRVNYQMTDPMNPRSFDIISVINFRKITESEYKFYGLNDKKVVDSLKYLGKLYDQFLDLLNKLEEHYKSAQRAYSELNRYELEQEKIEAEKRKKLEAKNSYYKDLIKNAKPFSFIKDEELECLTWPVDLEQEYSDKIQEIHKKYEDPNINLSENRGLAEELEQEELNFESDFMRWVREYKRNYKQNLRYVIRLHQNEDKKVRESRHQGRAAVVNHRIKHGAKIAREQMKQFELYKKYQLGIEETEN